jgi:aspartyl aminopeptidase
MLYPASPEAATRFLKFVNASPTPFHAVQNASVHLEKAGFLKVSCKFFKAAEHFLISSHDQIRETDSWEKNVTPGGKYYFTRSIPSYYSNVELDLNDFWI